MTASRIFEKQTKIASKKIAVFIRNWLRRKQTDANIDGYKCTKHQFIHLLTATCNE